MTFDELKSRSKTGRASLLRLVVIPVLSAAVLLVTIGCTAVAWRWKYVAKIDDDYSFMGWRIVDIEFQHYQRGEKLSDTLMSYSFSLHARPNDNATVQRLNIDSAFVFVSDPGQTLVDTLWRCIFPKKSDEQVGFLSARTTVRIGMTNSRRNVCPAYFPERPEQMILRVYYTGIESGFLKKHTHRADYVLRFEKYGVYGWHGV